MGTLRATRALYSLLADPGDTREGAGGKGTGGRTGCSVVAERVKQTAAGAEPGRERQRKAQAAEEEHPELCGGDGDCFENRADCKAAGGVWPGLRQQQRSGRGRQGSQMRLERALLTSAGGEPLPPPETVSWLVVVICLRRLWGIPSGTCSSRACSSRVVEATT